MIKLLSEVNHSPLAEASSVFSTPTTSTGPSYQNSRSINNNVESESSTITKLISYTSELLQGDDYVWDSNAILDSEREKQHSYSMDFDARMNEQNQTRDPENLSYEENRALRSELSSIKLSLGVILDNQQYIMETLSEIKSKQADLQNGLLQNLTDIKKSGLKTSKTLDKLTATKRLPKCFVNRCLPVLTVPDFLEVDKRLIENEEDRKELVRQIFFVL